MGRIDLEKAAVFATGCTSKGDAYTEEGEQFALIYNGSDSVLLMHSKSGAVHLLSGEHDGFWEAMGGMWSFRYARDITDSLSEQPFRLYDESFTKDDVWDIFSADVCNITFESLQQYDPRDVKP